MNGCRRKSNKCKVWRTWFHGNRVKASEGLPHSFSFLKTVQTKCSFFKGRPLCISFRSLIQLNWVSIIWFYSPWILSVSLLASHPYFQSSGTRVGKEHHSPSQPWTSDRWGGGGLAWPGARTFSLPDPSAMLVGCCGFETDHEGEGKTALFKLKTWAKILKTCITTKAFQGLKMNKHTNNSHIRQIGSHWSRYQRSKASVCSNSWYKRWSRRIISVFLSRTNLQNCYKCNKEL